LPSPSTFALLSHLRFSSRPRAPPRPPLFPYTTLFRSRRCDIAYEFGDGSVAYDDIPDPLPFDVEAPVIEIPAEFFGIFYMDCMRSEEHTSELQSRFDLVCRLLLEKNKAAAVLTPG